MGLTERHWFEDEEPELTENQLEDILWENNKMFERGYQKGFSDGKTAILREREPRVMTLEEVKRERVCWIEDANDGMTDQPFPTVMIGTDKYANGSKSCIFLAQKPWSIDVNDCEWWYLIEDYGKTWRCWSYKPTNEQREAVKWGG